MAFTLVLAAGCESPPPTNLQLIASSANFVDNDVDRSVDWEYVENEFAVTPPTQFQFFAKASREKIKQSLERIDAMPSYLVGKPEGIEESDYLWLRRFTEKPTQLQWQSIKDAKVDNSKDAFCMARDGLQLVTVGSEVVVWDTIEGKQLSSIPAALSNCKHAFLDVDQKSVFIANSIEIVRQRIADGEVVSRWKPANGPISNVVKARDIDVLAAVTQNGDLAVFDQDLQAKAKLQLESPFNRDISIRANGRAIVFASRKGASTWNIESQSQSPATLPMFGKLVESFERTQTSSGLLNDHWIQGHCAFLLIDGQIPKDRPDNARTYLLGYDVQFAHSATVDGTQDWLVTIGTRRDRTGKRVNQIQDLSLQGFDSSSSQVLDRESISAASFDQTGERVAIRSEKGLEVFARKRWPDEAGMILQRKVSELFRAGHFDRMEICATEIRKIGWRKHRWTGVEYWDDCAIRIATNWVDAVANANDAETISKIENWASQKSDLALLVTLICSESAKGRLLAGQSYGVALTQEQTESLSNHLAKWNTPAMNVANIKLLMERGDPTPACFAMAIHECNPEKLLTVGDRVLQKCVERWPTCFFPHRVVLDKIIKRDGAKSEQCYAYVSTLPQLLPADHPLAKGIMASVACSTIDVSVISGDPPFSRPQQNAIVKNIFSELPLPAWCYEAWFPSDFRKRDLAKQQRTDIVRRMVEYHQQNYEIPTKRFYALEPTVQAYSQYMDEWMR